MLGNAAGLLHHSGELEISYLALNPQWQPTLLTWCNSSGVNQDVQDPPAKTHSLWTLYNILNIPSTSE